MPDRLPPNSKPPASDGDGRPGDGSEQELDEILARAASLAENLGNEIGTSPEASEPTEPPPGDRRLDSREINLDTELDELDRLVASASDDLGASPPSTAPSKEPALHKSSPADDDLPDFMREFTQPEPPPPSTAQSATRRATTTVRDITNDVSTFNTDLSTHPSIPTPLERSHHERETEAIQSERSAGTTAKTPTPAKPGVVGTGKLGVVTAASQAAAPPGDPVAVSEALVLSPPPAKRTVMVLCSRVAYLACEWGIRLVEQVDRPLGSIGMRIRRLAGWFALATLATAIIVYIIALL